MQSNIFDRISFYVLFATIVLLPIFFLPFSGIPVEVSKSLMLVVGLGAVVVLWAIARFFDGRVSIPRSPLLLSGFVIVLVFFAAAMFSPVRQWSLIGIVFDVGSFAFIFACFVLMFLSAMILKEGNRSRAMLWGAVVSFTAVLLFQIARLVFFREASLGVFSSPVDNLFGSWNSLGILAGLLGVVALFMIEFMSIDRRMKWLLGLLLVFSFGFAALVGYSLVFWLLGSFALFIFVFKMLYYVRIRQNPEVKAEFPMLPLAVLVVSILFMLSGLPIKSFLPIQFRVANTVEIRPPLSSTFTVAQKTLADSPVFGAGPNRFGEMWAIHKPLSVNAGSLWDVNFDFGWGLLPTFVVTTGVLGIVAWLAFFVLFVIVGMKSVFRSILQGTNYEPAVFFISSFYLFLASFFYPTGIALFLLAFVFAGGFAGLQSMSQGKPEVSLSFLDDPRKSFFVIILLVVLIISTVVAVFKFTERFSSVSYFRQALSAKDITTAETNILKALSLNWNDLYLRTHAQIEMIKLNSEATGELEPADEELKNLQSILDQAINAAVAATVYNHTNHTNFQVLGNVYDLAGYLGVPNAYSRAAESYRAASNLNPGNPGLKLLIARATWATGEKVDAEEYAKEALSVKPNYIAAMLFLAQTSKSEGDNASARSYAERALSFVPGNKEIISFIESLGKADGKNI